MATYDIAIALTFPAPIISIQAAKPNVALCDIALVSPVGFIGTQTDKPSVSILNIALTPPVGLLDFNLERPASLQANLLLNSPFPVVSASLDVISLPRVSTETVSLSVSLANPTLSDLSQINATVEGVNLNFVLGSPQVFIKPEDQFINAESLGVDVDVCHPSLVPVVKVDGVDLTLGFGAVGLAASISPDEVSLFMAIGLPRLLSQFVPSVYHTKVFKLLVGDLDVSNRVTTLNGEKSAEAHTFSLTLAGAVDLADELSGLVDEAVSVFAGWKNNKTGKINEMSLILDGEIDSMNLSRGGRSSSLVINCKILKEVEAIAVEHDAYGVEYILSGDRSSLRMPVDLNYEVGDTLNYNGGSMLISKVSYAVGDGNADMTVSE